LPNNTVISTFFNDYKKLSFYSRALTVNLANYSLIVFSDILVLMILIGSKSTSLRWFKTIPSTPIGPVTIVVSKAGLLQVNLAPAGDHHSSPDFLPQEPAPDCLNLALHQIESYLNGALNTFSIPIDCSQQSPFQQIVLKAAMQIPYGEIVTYGQLASSVGRPSAARAVGGALGRNPMPLVIPCHRVVGADRRLHGYSAPG
jgi:O-6-methylguanine DNA methyltransferase